MNAKDLKLLALVIVPLAAAPISLNTGSGAGEVTCLDGRIALVERLQQLRSGLRQYYAARICQLGAS